MDGHLKGRPDVDDVSTPTKRSSTNRKRRWGPPLPMEQIDFRKKQAQQQHPPPDNHHRSPHNHHHKGGGGGGTQHPIHEQKKIRQESIQHEDDLSLKRFKNFRRGRSSSTCRFQHPTFETRHKGTWRCLVCYLWNDIERYQCSRCGAKEGVDKEVATKSIERDHLAHAYSGYRANNSGGRGRSQEPRSILRSSSYGPSIDRGEDGLPLDHQGWWPPVFESNGSSYVFDSRSEMFYESNSDFFYDPKSKLYFSNKKRAYFRHIASCNSFIQVTDSFPNDTKTGQPEKTKLKKSIAIKIKSNTTMSLKRPRSKSCGTAAAGPDPTEAPLGHRMKDQLANIKKWEEQQRIVAEKKGSSTAGKPARLTRDFLSRSLDRARQACESAERSMSQQRELTPAGLLKEQSTATSSSQSLCGATKATTPKTALRNTICVLCKRKFASIDMLKRHELHSDLHRRNLLLKARDSLAAAAVPKAQQPAGALSQSSSAVAHTKRPSTTNYTDRASKRRALYGQNLSTPAAPKPVSFSLTEQPVRTLPVDPTTLLGLGNVGHQLFHKMLAKYTPKESSNTANPAVLPSDNAELTGSLRKDWERIEAMSKGGGGGLTASARFYGAKDA